MQNIAGDEVTQMYTLINGIPGWGEHGESTLTQIERCADEVHNHHNYAWKETHAGEMEAVKLGEISRQMMLKRVRAAGVELRGAGTDESPHVYRRLRGVLNAHADSIRILHTLRPIGVAMAGEDGYDPYKD